jgi:hypothetical protein
MREKDIDFQQCSNAFLKDAVDLNVSRGWPTP